MAFHAIGGIVLGIRDWSQHSVYQDQCVCVCVCVCDRPLLCRPGMQGTDNQICEKNRPKGDKQNLNQEGEN